MTQMEYLKQQLLAVLAIDSPTGHTAAAAQYVLEQYRALGFAPALTNKGGVLVCVNEGRAGGEGGLLLEAHLDTLGAMVAEIKPNGRLRLTPLGGLNANNTEAENVRLATRGGRVFSGTFQLKNASVHVNGEYSNEKRTFDSMELVLDEDAASKEEVLALGIRTGDIACFDARTTITESGYIKSRFLDDKLSVAILLAQARGLAEGGKRPARAVWHHITVFEEVGHGGSASVPQGRHRGHQCRHGLRGRRVELHGKTGVHLREGFRRPVPRGCGERPCGRGTGRRRGFCRGHISLLRLGRRGHPARRP